MKYAMISSFAVTGLHLKLTITKVNILYKIV